MYFYFGSKASFSSSDNVVEVLEGFICISHSAVILCGDGRSFVVRDDYHPQCVCLYLEWRWERGSFASFAMSLPLFAFTTVCLLSRMEVGEGLICIYHSVSPSTLNGGGGGSHLHLPQCVSLYLEWRWGRGSFAFTTVCLPLP